MSNPSRGDLPPSQPEPGPQPEPQSEPQFTVPVPVAPNYTVPVPRQERTESLPARSGDTQILPTEPTQAAQPAPPRPEHRVPPPPTGPSYPTSDTPQWPYAAGPADVVGSPSAGAGAADTLRTVGLVLLGVTLGWWLFFAVRLLWWLVQLGVTDTMVYRTIDVVQEETIVAAVVSILAAVALLAARAQDPGRRATVPAVIAGVVAVATIGITVWRLV